MPKKKIILAIGGAVIKTAREELYQIAEKGMFDVLIHNGGSLFHDFQIATSPDIAIRENPYYLLDEIIDDYKINEKVAEAIWDWIGWDEPAPKNSVTWLCKRKKIKVLMFTALACDFWQLFGDARAWGMLGSFCQVSFETLCNEMKSPFHFVCMGSAVIMPEVFIKAIAYSKPQVFSTEVVDFENMYRPRTRIAKYGEYHRMTHKEYLKLILDGEITWGTNDAKI